MTTCFLFYWDTPAVNPAFLKHSICWVFLSAHPICRFPGSCKHTTHCLNNLLYTHANRRATQTGAQRKRFCLLRGDASKLQTAINMHLHTRAPSRTHTNKLSSLLAKSVKQTKTFLWVPQNFDFRKNRIHKLFIGQQRRVCLFVSVCGSSLCVVDWVGTEIIALSICDGVRGRLGGRRVCLRSIEAVNSVALLKQRAGPTNSFISHNVTRGQLTLNLSPAARGACTLLTAPVLHCKTCCCCVTLTSYLQQ